MTQQQRIRVGIVGCGGRGRAQAEGYPHSEGAQIVAVCDPVLEAAQGLAQKHGVDASGVHTDLEEMLGAHQLDMLSVCTWPAQHHDQVLAGLRAGARAILCEKPMAPTPGEARAMHLAAEKAGAQLSFCHQRRFNPQFRTARRLLREGAVGRVQRLEGFCPNLFDWGTHWFDMFFFLNEETPAEWVMGQIDIANARTVFGAWVESSGLSYVRFANGVHGLMATGKGSGGDCAIRAIGTDGLLEVPHSDGGPVRLLRAGSAWEEPELETMAHGDSTVLSVMDAVQSLREGREPELSSRKALQATELIFASYESSRRGARISLPLEIDDSPLIDLINRRDA
jgi:UDP-N-acetylglucosamine 3-dehydrogenase